MYLLIFSLYPKSKVWHLLSRGLRLSHMGHISLTWARPLSCGHTGEERQGLPVREKIIIKLLSSDTSEENTQNILHKNVFIKSFEYKHY